MIKTDVLVVGGGVIGSALAMHLAPHKKVTVIDPDMAGSFSSSELNAGGVRSTFSTPLNIEVSHRSLKFFETIADAVGYRACGYHWCKSPTQLGSDEKTLRLWNECGIDVERVPFPEIKKRFPYLDKITPQDIEEIWISPKDGLINPNLLKLYYREKAQNAGAVFLDKHYLINNATLGVLENSGGALGAERILLVGFEPEKKPVAEATLKLDAGIIINAAGAWASLIAEKLGYQIPCTPVRRSISLFQSQSLDFNAYGMMIDPSGVYYHPEAISILAGKVCANDPVGFNFDYQGEQFFQEEIWAALYDRSTYFEELKHVQGWSGLYEVSPDDTAIVGEANVPGMQKQKIFDCHSFSGHGVMQSHAATEYLADLILWGQSKSNLDLSSWSSKRFLNPESLIHETAVI